MGEKEEKVDKKEEVRNVPKPATVSATATTTDRTTNHEAEIPISAHQPSVELETSDPAEVTAPSMRTPVLSPRHLLVQAPLTLRIVKMSAMKLKVNFMTLLMEVVQHRL
jgi:hypothetical protein